jgi:putative flippase GtrA
MNNPSRRVLGVRWMKFSLVGAIGIGVQLGTLAFLTTVFRVAYMLATALAVESAVLHNFVWHELFTWADRNSRQWNGVPGRLLRFNVTTGSFSIGGNLLLVRLLVGHMHVDAMHANLMAVVGCSVGNFVVNDRWVFRAPLGSLGGTPRDDRTATTKCEHRLQS